MNETVIELENVSFAYGEHRVLEDVDLRIDAGEFVAILGPNGGGKTTLLKIILGLLSLTEGRCWFLGRNREKVIRV